MPSSAPRPSCPPSVKRVEALTIMAAESIPAMKALMTPTSWARTASVWLVVWARMWSMASSRFSTTRTARSSDPYSVSQSASVASVRNASRPLPEATSARIRRATGSACKVVSLPHRAAAAAGR